MRFWDSSAIVPLLVEDPASAEVLEEFEHDPQIVAWWSTETECASAILRKERERVIDQPDVTTALHRLSALVEGWQEVQPTVHVRRTSIRLLRVHQLRAADALQLAAAIVVADGHPASLGFVTRDARLADAATREGFSVVTPGTPY